MNDNTLKLQEVPFAVRAGQAFSNASSSSALLR